MRLSEELIQTEKDFERMLDTFWRPYYEYFFEKMGEEVDRSFGITEEIGDNHGTQVLPV